MSDPLQDYKDRLQKEDADFQGALSDPLGALKGAVDGAVEPLRGLPDMVGAVGDAVSGDTSRDLAGFRQALAARHAASDARAAETQTKHPFWSQAGQGLAIAAP